VCAAALAAAGGLHSEALQPLQQQDDKQHISNISSSSSRIREQQQV
jgi:hypothetical protein